MKLENASLRELLDNDTEALNSVYEAYLRSVHDIEIALSDALVANEKQEIINATHKLKSSAFSVGAMELGRQCEWIESHTFSLSITELAPHIEALMLLSKKANASIRILLAA